MIKRIIFLAMLLGASGAEAKDHVYKVTFNGFSFGEMQLSLNLADGKYEIVTTAQAKGFLGMILQSEYEGRANGRLTAGRLLPTRFYVKSDRIFKHRETEIIFENHRPIRVNLSPEKDHTELTDPTKVTDNRIDSLSGLFAMFTAPPGKCVGPLALYDGRRLQSVRFGAAEVDATKTACKGQYRIDRGPDHSIQKGQRVFDLVFTYPTAGGAPDSVEVISGGNSVTLTKQ